MTAAAQVLQLVRAHFRRDETAFLSAATILARAAKTPSIRSLSNQVRTKATYRDVPCERVKDLRLKKIIEKRCDTGEVLFERALTEAECQAELDFPDAKPGDLDADFDEPPSAGA